MLGAAAVLGHHQAAAGGEADVVRGLAGQLDVRVRAEDDHQREAAGGGVVAPDLPVVVRRGALRAAGEGGDEVDAATAPVAALQFLRVRDALGPEVLEADGGLHGEGVRHVDPLDLVEARARLLDRGQVGDARNPHRLEPPARAQGAQAPARPLRKEAVEEAERLLEGVLGLVDDAVARVHRDRLVLEAAHRGQRDRAGAVRVVRVDLEDEAVVLGVPVGARLVLGLLAGQPGPPRGGPARAVDGRTRDGDTLGQDAVAGVQRQRRAAALTRRVVGEAGDGRDGPWGGGAVLVVAHQVDAAAVPGGAAPGEGGHAVVVGGDRPLPGAQLVALAGQDPVGEAPRQVEQAVRVGDQRAVSGVAQVLRGCGSREELGEIAGEGDRDAQGAGTGQDLTARRTAPGCRGGVGRGVGHGETFLLADRNCDPAVSITCDEPREPRA